MMKGKAEQTAFEVPVVFQAKALVAGQLVGGDGDEARVRCVHRRGKLAHARRNRD